MPLIAGRERGALQKAGGGDAKFHGFIEAKLEDLPSNPKLWSPSQLATYLAHVLKLGPQPLVRFYVLPSLNSGDC